MLSFLTVGGFCFGLSSALGVDWFCLPIVGQAIIVPRLSKQASLPKSVTMAQGGSTRADGHFLHSLSSTRLQLQRRHPIIPKTVKLPPGILCHPAVQSLPPRKAQSLTLVQRREQPGRRKDSIQSLYIAAGTELLFPSSPTASDTSSTQELQTSSRRFSDPDIAFVKDEV
ncbi:hypothetical protein M9458_045397 [Cirrhinus mrigala]|uniref:Uncharacterized protein n=1 Tax=Cirrhinus mrigala TaxID=683832 RepID=A0ABD0NI76_CIRMR